MNKSIIFLSDSTTSSTIVNGEDNSVLFELSTPFGIKKSTTTITDRDGKVVGTYERSWTSAKVTVRGEKRKVREWMSKKCDLYWSHVFNAPDGRTYAWKYRKGADALKLVEHDTQKTVGKAHSAHHLIDKRKKRVDFDPDLSPIIDVILLAFIIAEEDHIAAQQASA